MIELFRTSILIGMIIALLILTYTKEYFDTKRRLKLRNERIKKRTNNKI